MKSLPKKMLIGMIAGFLLITLLAGQTPVRDKKNMVLSPETLYSPAPDGLKCGHGHGKKVSAGGPYFIYEGGSLKLKAKATESPKDYLWDLNNDNIFGDAQGKNIVLSWSDLRTIMPDIDGFGIYFIRVKAIYSKGKCGEKEKEVISPYALSFVFNIAPTATLNNNGPVNAGETAIVYFSDQYDPSLPDMNAGFRYSYDFDNDGCFEIKNSTSLSATVPDSFFNGPGVYTIHARIRDKDYCGKRDYYTDITVLNAIPELILTGNDTTLEGELYNLYVGVMNPSVSGIDSWTINWGDGTSDYVEGPEHYLTHVYPDDSTYVIQATATDANGSYMAEKVVEVLNVSPVITATGDANAFVGQTYQINFETFDPGDDQATEWHINWGDGISDTLYGNIQWAEHIYEQPGAVIILVEVVDEDSEPDTAASTSLEVMVSVDPADVSAGEPYLILEGDSLHLTATAPGSPVAFTWDINNDGVFYDAEGSNPALSWTTLQTIMPDIDGPMTSFLYVKVMYGDGSQVTSSDAILSVDNTTPTATLSNSGPVDEGETAMVTFSDQSDPSHPDIIAGFLYSYDFNNDGIWEIENSTLASETVPDNLLDDDGLLTIRAGIIDKDGGMAEYLTEVTVLNVAPTVVLNTQVEVNEGASLILTGTITDPGVNDTHEVVIDWDDGSEKDTLLLDAGILEFSATHTYPDNEIATIQVSVTDDDGGTDMSSIEVTINNVAPVVTSFAVYEQEIDENGTVTATGVIEDAGILDTHTATISWDDGTTSPATLDPNTGIFTASHQYLDDDPSGTRADEYYVVVTVTDDDGGEGYSIAELIVLNVAPVFTSLYPDTTIIEIYDTLTLTGTFTDPGTLDGHTILVDWGDGASENLKLSPGILEFSIIHQYVEEEIDYISVMVTDDDRGEDIGIINITIIEGKETPISFEMAGLDHNITVFPNPATDFIIIHKKSGYDLSLRYILFDMEGRVLYQQETRDSDTYIPLNGFEPSVYFLKITDNHKESKTFTIIKR